MSSICLKKIQNFIKFCNFYRRFIKNFSKIVRFMIKLIQKNTMFHWFEICQKTFQMLKNVVIFVSIFRHFDHIRKLILKTDFFDYVNDDVLSQYDNDDVLSQYDNNEILYSIIFYNKNMMSTKCNYEIYDKKLLIIIKYLKY